MVFADDCVQSRSFPLVDGRWVVAVSLHRPCEVKAEGKVLPEIVSRDEAAIFSSMPVDGLVLNHSVLCKHTGLVQPQSVISKHPHLASNFPVELIDRLQHL